MKKKDFSETFESLTSQAIHEVQETPEEEAQDTQDAPQAQEAQKETEPQEAPTAEEVRQAQETQHTQGRKGYKMQRICMAFTPDNIDYIRIVSKIKGCSMTNFVNDIVTADRESNSELFEQLKEFNKKL